MKVGLISDTHSYLDPKIFQYFDEVDEIWHAGDIGSLEVADQLAAFKPFKAVYGNIDMPEIRHQYPEQQRFICEGFDIMIIHIGGSPPNYNPAVKKIFNESLPDIFICGHSHILKAVKDPKRKDMLYLNPGAAGTHGFHKIRTVMRFEFSEKATRKLEVIELGKRASKL